MAFGAALPRGIELRAGEAAATFVVPARNGCNLNCPFCAVRARRETVIEDVSLGTDDYVRFLDALAAEVCLGAVTLQGYEPLLPESWQCSVALLSAGNQLGVPTALITNGTFLAERVAALEELNVQGVTVSLDSGQAESHDISRRTPGTFTRAVEGLRKAAVSALRDRMIVASVLQPGKGHYLDSMPELLSQIGVRQWIVTPLYKIRKSDIGGPADDHERIVAEMVRLQRLASGLGIEMLVDDEFGRMTAKQGKVVNLSDLRLRRMKRIEQILRLSPNGSFSIGSEILRTVNGSTPSWNPAVETAPVFVGRLFRETANPAVRLFHRRVNQI